MPIHDWSRVDAGLFHDFHQSWMGALRTALNLGVLPKPFDALIEQYSGKAEVDVLTLHSNRARASQAPEEPVELQPFAGTATVLETRPDVDTIKHATDAYYVFKKSNVVIREVRNDRVVALIEVVSRGNKTQEYAVERFIDKVANALMAGINVVVIDLQPTGTWDPQGIHDVIWRAIGQNGYAPPPGKLPTQVAYTGAPDLSAYIKPAAVGDVLARLPLFLSSTRCIQLPLEDTYLAAYAGVPEVWRDVIEGRAEHP